MDFTLESIEQFKEANKKALEEKKETFIFNGQEVLCDYAKYVIEYYEPLIKKKYGKQSN